MALTPKQQRLSFDGAMAAKLGALRDLSERVGLLGSFAQPISLENDDRDAAIALALLNLVDADSPWFQRAACRLMLDIFVPGWIERLPVEVVGIFVERDDAQVRAWRSAVLARDGYACRSCGASEQLEAHHILRWADFPEARVMVDNGMTLCSSCHKAAHRRH